MSNDQLKINSQTQNNPQPRFTGTFIPVEIMELEGLTPLDMILLGCIDALFCKSHGGCFASNKYLAEKLRVKENTIVKSLIKLRSMGLIEDISFNGRNRVIRALVGRHVDRCQSQAACDLNHRQTVIKITPSSRALYKDKTNNSDIKEDILLSEVFDHGLSDFFLSLILKNKPDFKKPNLKQWAKHVDLMIRVDKRDPAEIRRVMEWISKDPFESSAVLSTEKLRKRFDQLQMKSKNQSSKENQADTNKKIAIALLDKYVFPSNVIIEKLSKHVEIHTNGAMQADCITYDSKGFEEQLLKAILKNKGRLKAPSLSSGKG